MIRIPRPIVLVAAGVSAALATTPVSGESQGIFSTNYGVPLPWILNFGNRFSLSQPLTWIYFAVDVVFFTAVAYSILFLAQRRKDASSVKNTGLQLPWIIATALISLGFFALLLDLWNGLTSSFIVNGYCAGTINNLTCNYVYDYSPLFLPAAVGGILVASGLLIYYLIRRHRTRETQRSKETIVQYPWLSRTGLVKAFYIIIPILTMSVLFHLGPKWSGFPLVYAGRCLLQVYGDLSWCYTFIWFGFWVDSMFFTALGYACIILLSRIKRI